MKSRKKSKPNPPAQIASQGALTPEKQEIENPVPEDASKQAANNAEPVNGDTAQVSDKGSSTPQNITSWYGGTWPRGNKSPPVTQVVRESITAAGTATGKVASDVVASARANSPQPPSSPLRSPASYLSRRAGSSTRSLPLAAATTKLNISSSVNEPENVTPEEGLKEHSSSAPGIEAKAQIDGNGDPKAESLVNAISPNDPANKDVPGTESSQKPPEEKRPTFDSASWLAWFTKTENAGANVSNRPQSTISPVVRDTPPSPTQRRNSEPSLSSPVTQREEAPRSWLGIWSSTAKEPKSSSASATGIATNSLESSSKPPPDKDTALAANTSPASESLEAAKSYGWAFWSRDDSRDPGGKKRRPSNVGELALAGSPSQSKPENAVVDESRGIPDRVSKRPRPQSMQEQDDTPKMSETKAPTKQDIETSASFDPPKTATSASAKAKKQPKNLVLPSFKKTYRTASRPGLIQQLSRLFQVGPSSEPKHVDISSPRKVSTALAIGVHGYFPVPLIRSVLGQPTGTSIRFANSAASAIQKWTQDQGYSCEIEKVALEGEGKIAERIELLWKLMLNWIEKIRKADFVMIACHSQGVPVAMMLVAKLIAFGCVNSARIGVCAMAGVNLGPFADYKSRWISGSAGELFDFAVPDSQVSKGYEAALDVALRFGVRIVYVGSIDDQLVSLESSTFGTLSHPYVYRAVFIDGRVHAPDFLTHLVGFALKLRNLGISDHGLIRELSSPLAGSLYGGEGHSRIYDDEAVYYLAVEHALETTSVANVPMQSHRGVTPSGQNPYILPFAMRGLLEEHYVKTELYGEISELIRQFDDWKPSKTVLKDVKFRLEGVRSKL